MCSSVLLMWALPHQGGPCFCQFPATRATLHPALDAYRCKPLTDRTLARFQRAVEAVLIASEPHSEEMQEPRSQIAPTAAGCTPQLPSGAREPHSLGSWLRDIIL